MRSCGLSWHLKATCSHHAAEDNMRQFIKKKPMRKMQPWYRGFCGTIKASAEKGRWNAVTRLLHAVVQSPMSLSEASTTAMAPSRKRTQPYCRLRSCRCGSGHRTTRSGLDFPALLPLNGFLKAKGVRPIFRNAQVSAIEYAWR